MSAPAGVSGVIVACGRCHRERNHHAKGLCAACYNAEMKSRQATRACDNCEELRVPGANGRCARCYQHQHKHGTPWQAGGPNVCTEEFVEEWTHFRRFYDPQEAAARLGAAFRMAPDSVRKKAHNLGLTGRGAPP